jgi:hypothetical protein
MAAGMKMIDPDGFVEQEGRLLHLLADLLGSHS